MMLNGSAVRNSRNYNHLMLSLNFNGLNRHLIGLLYCPKLHIHISWWGMDNMKDWRSLCRVFQYESDNLVISRH